MRNEKSNSQVRGKKYRKIAIIIAGIALVLLITFLKLHSITACYVNGKLVYNGNYYKQIYAQYEGNNKYYRI